MAKTDTLAAALIEGVLAENPAMIRVALEAMHPGQLRAVREAADEVALLCRNESQLRPAWSLPA